MTEIENQRNPTISENWTEEERKQVAIAITGQMLSYRRSLVRTEEMHNWAERIYLVLTRSESFLEKNREEILKETPFLNSSK